MRLLHAGIAAAKPWASQRALSYLANAHRLDFETSGVILLALPFGLFLMMLHIKPDYVEKLWTHPLGIKMLVGALIMQVLGAIVIKKIVNIKV